MKVRQFVDTVTLHVAAGDGGNGCLSFRREKFVPHGGPNGGDGGRGGHVILHADRNTDSLIALYFAPHQRAQDGGHGKGKELHGRDGQNRIVNVPCGTEVWDMDTGELVGDLVRHGEELLVASGGRGGLGNPHWQTPTHRTPLEHTDGESGEKKTLRLDLKVIADVGLVGFPNAGKSSLIRQISRARPRVAPYPFTTLNPILATVMCDDFTSFTVADIPGLVKNAHQGAGLGDRFLRHIERTSCLVYVMDMGGADGRNPADDYTVLRAELRQYRKDLLRRPCLVVANKMDLPAAAENLVAFRKKTGTDPLPVSALTGEGVARFKESLREMVRAEAKVWRNNPKKSS